MTNSISFHKTPQTQTGVHYQRRFVLVDRKMQITNVTLPTFSLSWFVSSEILHPTWNVHQSLVDTSSQGKDQQNRYVCVAMGDSAKAMGGVVQLLVLVSRLGTRHNYEPAFQDPCPDLATRDDSLQLPSCESLLDVLDVIPLRQCLVTLMELPHVYPTTGNLLL